MVDINLITELRKKVKDELGPDEIDKVDLERWEKDDAWVGRFLSHQDLNMKAAFKMATEALKWRKEFEINTLNPSMIPKFLMQLCGIYMLPEKDKGGHRILVNIGRLHDRNSKKLPYQKKYATYWVEQLMREAKGEKITLLIDMRDMTLKNVDMDFIKFFFYLFIYYYPDVVENMLVYESSWILSATWKIIKSWFDPKLANSMKFVDKKSLMDYIDEDVLPVDFEGKSSFECTWDGSGADIEV